MSSFGILFVRRKRLFFEYNPTAPQPPQGAKACWSHMPMSYPMSLCRYFIRKKRLVEDLSRLLNDIRYGSFIIVGLPGKLPKASGLRPIFFQQKREKIKDTTLLTWSEIRKLSARQDLLWSSF